MNATRILPDLQSSLLCEEVRQEANGNLFLIGVMNFMRVPQLPIVAGRLCIINRWTAGLGQFNEKISILAPDQTTVVSKAETKFELRDPSHSATGVMVFGNVEFKTAGTYYVEVMVDDVMKLRYPMPVIHAPPRPESAETAGEQKIRPKPPEEKKI